MSFVWENDKVIWKLTLVKNSFHLFVTGLTSHLPCGGGTLCELSNYISNSNHIYYLCIDKANWTSETLNILPKVTKLVGTRAGDQKRRE